MNGQTTTFGRRGTARPAAPPAPPAPPRSIPDDPFDAPTIDLSSVLVDTEVEDELKRWKAARRAGRWTTRARWREMSAAATLGAAVARLAMHGPLVWPISIGLGAVATVCGIVGWFRPRA